MRVKIGSHVYEGASIDRVSIGDLMKLEPQTAEYRHGQPMAWSEIRALAQRCQEMTAEDLVESDDLPMFLGIIVWASRLNAGEKITFGEAVDFPMGDLEFIPDPQDHKQAAGPQKARPGSGRAVKRQAAKRTSKTSAKASTAE